MTVLLEADNVTKVFRTGGSLVRRGTLTALENFSLRIEGDRAPVIAIAGESGSGKSTLVQLLLGILHPNSGHIRYQGTDLKAMTPDARRTFRREVQAIFQDPFGVYNPFYRVDHVLETPIRKFRLATNRDAMRRRIEEALRRVGLRPEETLGRYPHQLSGGQRQRIMIARALLLQPRVIVADEPVSMVDASMRATILESLLTLNRELGIALLYVTHDLTTAYQLCDDIYVLYRGVVAERGTVDRVIQDPQHPYTRLLVSSIPRPNPDQRWIEAEAVRADSQPRSHAGCRYAGRCPHVMPRCTQKAPALIATSSDRAVSCYLYDEVSTDQMTRQPL
jgi:peptide/nickel transport system ATP-binding protein